MRRKIFLLLCATTCLFTILTACGKDSETGGQKIERTEVETKEASKEEAEVEAKNEVTLSSAFSTDHDSIWYTVSNGDITKDSKPKVYYVFKDGTLYRYTDSEFTLGELSKMTDDEIIAALEKDAAAVPDASSGILEDCNLTLSNLELIAEYSEQINAAMAENGCTYTYEEVKASLEQCVDAITSSDNSSKLYDCKIALYTDGTGNAVSHQAIAYTYPTVSLNGAMLQDFNDYISLLLESENIGPGEEGYCYADAMMVLAPVDDVSEISVTLEKTSYFNGIFAGFPDSPIYDSLYGGYYYNHSDGTGALITRTDGDTAFVLDSLDESNVVIDPDDNWAE